MKQARNHYLDGSTDLTGITPDNFEGFKEYQPKGSGPNQGTVTAIQINYPFSLTYPLPKGSNKAGMKVEGKKGDYIHYTPSAPAVISKRWFENNYQEKVQ